MSDNGTFHAVFVAFVWTALAIGVAGMFAVLMWLGAMAYVKVLEYLKVWNTLKLITAIQLHGQNYRNELFWKAVQERAKISDFEAGNIIRHVNKSRPHTASIETI